MALKTLWAMMLFYCFNLRFCVQSAKTFIEVDEIIDLNVMEYYG